MIIANLKEELKIIGEVKSLASERIRKFHHLSQTEPLTPPSHVKLSRAAIVTGCSKVIVGVSDKIVHSQLWRLHLSAEKDEPPDHDGVLSCGTALSGEVFLLQKDPDTCYLMGDRETTPKEEETIIQHGCTPISRFS